VERRIGTSTNAIQDKKKAKRKHKIPKNWFTDSTNMSFLLGIQATEFLVL